MGDPAAADFCASLGVSSSLGPVGPLLQQLRSLSTARPESGIQGLTKHLEGLCVSVLEHSEVEQPSSWMSEIRELCYDTKNYLDDAPFILMQDDAAQAELTPEDEDDELTPKEKQELAQLKFNALEARMTRASRRRDRYEIDPHKINKQQAKWLPLWRPRRLPVIHAELIDPRIDTLASMLLGTEEEKAVVSVVGVEGVGKTTLVKRLYHQTGAGGRFQCRAFVRVSANPDMRMLLTSIFTQIQLPGSSKPACCLDAQHLIKNIKQYLQGKRYMIIIDDLWSISIWDIIRRAFPDDCPGSRIITTTQFEDVASACCSYKSKNILKMEPLEGDQSERLFIGITFGSQDKDGCPETFRRVSAEISEKCGGLPLVTVNIASLLPIPSEIKLQQLNDIRDSLPPILRGNTSSEWINEVLNLMYNYLSPELKTCLLYFAVYPEGYTVYKNDVVKQWVVEGFTRDGQNKEEIARQYFDELVSRGMIQAVDTNSGEVLSCTLHHMVHDLIVKKSSEGNFIIGVDYSQSTVWLPHKVRRLSVQFGGERNARLPAGITLSEVRSLAYFGFYGCADFIEMCKLLRVLTLHVWADDCVDQSEEEEEGEEEERPGISRSGVKEVLTYDLSGINKFFPLRYLKVACNVPVKLPDEIQALQYLETLDVDDAAVVAIPSDIGRLSRLSSLKITVRVLSMQDICILQALPSLSALSLHVQTTPIEMIVFDKGVFSILKYFKFWCSVPLLKFQVGAMPDLQNLKLCFNAYEAHQQCIMPIGINHLPGLKEITAEIWGANTEVGSTFRTAISNHPNKPRIDVQSFVDSWTFYGDTFTSISKDDDMEEEEKKVDADSRKAAMSGVQEVSITATVVGWFVTPNITELMRVARECAATRFKLIKGNKKGLEKLVEDLEGIKRLLDQASPIFVNDQASLDVLWRLKDDIHDAEEVLDHFMLQMNASNHLIDALKSNKDSLSNRLVKLLKNLGETRNMARELLHKVPRISIMIRAETGPSPVRGKRSFYGYHDEYNQLYSMLRQQPDGNKVIAIVGHGGMGKTELARQAFRDSRDSFHLRIWVHAYSKNTAFELLQEIWRSVAGDRPVGEMNFPCLQRELQKLLASKRCLLVLDDVWNHESATCEVDMKHACYALESFTRFAEIGSRIVLTTRAKICATTFQADASIILDGIKHNEMTRLVNETANLGTDITKIQDMLDRQVAKLKGSPLAAVEIGDKLNGSPSSKCRKILEDIEQHLGSVLSNHLFTYRHLPAHLQRCFEFCSIFPNNWRFEPEKLARMWIAHGFVVEGTQQGLSMEDVARGYFDSLVDRSLFQEAVEPGGARGRETTYYVIHEQIHWMIRHASAKNCMSISSHCSSHSRSIPITVRHLSVTSACIDQLKEYDSTVLNRVRTLLILNNADGSGVDSTIDKGVLKQFKGVRVLDLAQTGLTQLPGTIGKLKHVRYLGLPSTMRTLCEQLTELFFLQTFSVSTDGRGKEHTFQLQMFPKNMKRLINMRHLDINADCITNISGIGALEKLQGSIVFRASEKAGHGVSELALMSSLSGTLSIKGLDTVASKEEAAAAQLASKGSVKVLKLEWGHPDPRRQVYQGLTDAAAAVLEGLQPHRYLRDLHITRYPGERSPAWLSGLGMLTRLYLRICTRLRVLPVLGGLPCLELLDIKELTIIERIDAGFCGSSGPVAFPSLETIVLDDMPELVAWEDMPKEAFPLLRDISIIDCPKLSLSGLTLEWSRSPVMRVKGCPKITAGTLPKGVSTCKFN